MEVQNRETLSMARAILEKTAQLAEDAVKVLVNLLGIKFAPLDLPRDRRLQTLAATAWIVMMVFGEGAAILLAVFLIRSDYYWLVVIYIFMIAKNRDIGNVGGSRWEWARKWRWWEYFRDYFPLKLVKTTDLDPERNYLLCVFPHGVLSTGCFASFATDANGFHETFPGMTPYMLTLGGHFMVPFFRELVLWLGICSASAESINYLLNPKNGKGNCVALVVGGAAESLNCHQGQYTVVLNRRKGFIKMAMRNGSPLVPVFSFGETDLYEQINNPKGGKIRQLQDWFRTMTGIAPVIPMGRGIFQYTFGIVPQRRRVTTVVGTPMEVERNLDPTDEEIDIVHKEFTKRLVDMFEEGKKKYLKNPKEAQLTIE